MAHLAVALEHYLGDHDAFKADAKEKFNGTIPILKTYKEVVNDPSHGAKWREAIKLELDNLIRFGPWRYVRRPNVFDVKHTTDGRIDRFRARLVA